MTSLLVIIGKDLRLLWRDRAGLIFLTLAPLVVITVAGFSLANFYGADPSGQTAYEFPLVDEDGGPLAQQIHDHLAGDTAVHLREVATRAEAEHLIRDRKAAGSALVIPHGTEAALKAGQPASLILYVDSVKYLERLNVHTRLLELRDVLVAEQREQLGRAAAAERDRLQAELQRLQSAVAAARAAIDATWEEAQRARQQAEATAHATLRQAQRVAEAKLKHELAVAAAQMSSTIERDIQAQLAEVRAPLREYLDALTSARTRFETWLDELKRLAGTRAANIPPPPAFPDMPRTLSRFLDNQSLLRLPPIPALELTLPLLPALELPPLPNPPAIEIPADITIPEPPATHGSLTIEEVNLSGGAATINTFDQNVPGFSVTFLLLGMLLGVSLALLDERDWGTFDRLRAMPIKVGNVLLGKLLARFLVGLVQMVLLFAMGRVAFGISLGPQPWALLLPTVGIVFAGTAFGLIVAALTPTREAVLPVGSIVIVTMAAVGGCWWPIDLEPRWMRTVALAFPTTWAMDAFNDLMIRRRTVTAALWPSTVMLSYGLLYLAVGLSLFRRQVRGVRR